ncbi:MAG: hypothetical protein ACI4DK_10785 [Lachnospiraceae bacterium]
MGKITEGNNEVQAVNEECGLIELTEQLLCDARSAIESDKALSVPIAELSSLGAAVASIIPALNTVTQTVTIEKEGLFTIANAQAGDYMQVAKNGHYWASLKTADGKSRLVQLQDAGPISATTSTVAISPATMMMAVALYSIEKEIGQIAETGKQILSFLEIEKESEVEADVETLIGIMSKYKLSWDKELFVSSNYKLVLDIQRTARKNITAFQKKVSEYIKKKQGMTVQGKVKSTLAELIKQFKYYRLSLYIFSLASLLEIMLGGNFAEEYITGIKEEIKTLSESYRNLFEECSVWLEKMGATAVDATVVKYIGVAGKAVGKLIGSIPLVKEGLVDEFLQDKGERLQHSASEMEMKAVKEFAVIANPGTSVFEDKMDDIVRIFNRTSQICFDEEKIYLLTD